MSILFWLGVATLIIYALVGLDLLIGNLIKEQFLDNRDWPLGSTLSLLLTVAVLTLAGLSVRAGRSRRRDL